MKFTGTKNYVSTEDLSMAVNATIALERPLIIKGEPGTGKTLLAIEVAESLGMELIEWHVKSTTKASQGLYEYDAVTRLRDSQLGDERVKDIKNYIKKGKLWEAFESEKQVVLLIDEIDKADIEFPNDLLQELDRMEFYCYETGETIKAKKRPLIIARQQRWMLLMIMMRIRLRTSSNIRLIIIYIIFFIHQKLGARFSTIALTPSCMSALL